MLRKDFGIRDTDGIVLSPVVHNFRKRAHDCNHLILKGSKLVEKKVISFSPLYEAKESLCHRGSNYGGSIS